MKSNVVAEKIAWLRHDLRNAEGFAALVIRILANSDETHYRLDDILRTLNDLPISAIQAHKDQFEAIAIAPTVEPRLPSNLVETLTRAGAWEEAARINEVYVRIPETTEKHAQKLAANLYRIAAKFEEAIAKGRIDALPKLAQEWRTTEVQIEEDRIKYAERRSPFSGLPGAH